MKRFKVPEFDIKGIDIYINLKQLLSEQGEAKSSIINYQLSIRTMGKVTMNWLITGHSGRACKQDAVYTKINKQTGVVTSSKLCHPYEGEASAKQAKQRTRFGQVSKACQELIKANKENPSEDYKKILKAYDAQHKCGSMLGYMMQKIQDTRVGKTDTEYRAIVKGWITVEDETGGGSSTETGGGSSTETGGGSTSGSGTVPPPPGDDEGLKV